MDDPAETSVAEHHLTVPSDTSQIAALRRDVASIAGDGGADNALIGDLELAISELATNVVQHSDAHTISVVVRRDADRWTLEVDDAEGIDTHASHSLPAPEALSGRGLFIVHAVMDEVELIDDDGQRRLRCSKLVS